MTLVMGVVIAAWCTLCQAQLSKVQVGYCAKTISAMAAPYAVATKMGYFKEEGLDVTLVLLASSADCVAHEAYTNQTNKTLCHCIR